jgi:hypothetical protein
MQSNTGERRLEFGIRSLYSGMATVVIRDNGCGIAEDKFAKIFNPFYTTKKNGTGLGMGIAKKVMDAHSGRIEVQSKTGTGTEFRLSIPLADAARAQAQAGFNHATAADSQEAPANSAEPRATTTAAPRTSASDDNPNELRAATRDRQ